MTWRESVTKEHGFGPRREHSGDKRSQRTHVFGSHTMARLDFGTESETPMGEFSSKRGNRGGVQTNVLKSQDLAPRPDLT